MVRSKKLSEVMYWAMYTLYASRRGEFELPPNASREEKPADSAIGESGQRGGN